MLNPDLFTPKSSSSSSKILSAAGIIVSSLAFRVAISVSAAFLTTYILQHRSTKLQLKPNLSKVREKLKKDGRNVPLNSHEISLIQECIPEDINVKFDDIGGLEDIIDDLRETVVYPLTVPGLFSGSSPLLQAPKGVLLYGPPGCGKTMIAKALAHESSATFLNVKISSITDKWFGESNKYAAAIFSLARKLEPCIVFIDEIDSFLRSRETNDNEAMSMVKSEFMTQWDGLSSGGRIVILGATNRPNDIDAAFLRRMPKRYGIRLPDLKKRIEILKLSLHGTTLEEPFDFEKVARHMEGLSGSGIKEACRDAAMIPIREYFRDHRKKHGMKFVPTEENDALKTRPLRDSDFFVEWAAKKKDDELDDLE
ncbi:P-loop containing nucleoside triphosphate hydrolase protein [Myxozyma melibiosi]|uniref:P-loop containing nucleoside triphosphate hydrolase protein n=1 Tax=Myxozyma melibiosi TaxID=54550 RepID=A0ABR1FEX3_9ASCO